MGLSALDDRGFYCIAILVSRGSANGTGADGVVGEAHHPN
jgi:hypothetical protein